MGSSLSCARGVRVNRESFRAPGALTPCDRGRSVAVSGLAAHAVAYGVCAAGTRKRQRGKAPRVTAGAVVRLGRGLQEYALVADTSPAESLTQAMLAVVVGSGLAWPSSPSEAHAFGDGLVALAAEFRDLRIRYAGFAKSSYQGKCFTRAMLCGIAGLPSVSRGLLPGCFDNARVGDLDRWAPDRCQRIAPVAGMGAGAAQAVFGVPALTLSMWACLLGTLPPSTRQALTRAPDSALIGTIWHLELESAGCPLDAGSPTTPSLTEVAIHSADQAGWVSGVLKGCPRHCPAGLRITLRSCTADVYDEGDSDGDVGDDQDRSDNDDQDRSDDDGDGGGHSHQTALRRARPPTSSRPFLPALRDDPDR